MAQTEAALASPDLIQTLTVNRARLRKRLLQLHFEAKVGHVGGNLSCLDLMATLFPILNWSQDRFVLSKGHSAGALYTALWSVGRLSESELKAFHQDHSPVGGHPSPFFKTEIPFFTGSLGHGLGLACGLAKAKQLQNRPGQIYVLLSDGEWQEGSTWEALNFALHHRLGNLRVLVDFNGLQGFGGIEEVQSMANLPERLTAMGATVERCPGHNIERIMESLLRPAGPQPQFSFYETQKGHGISFMENQMDWHYWNLNEAQYLQALLECDGMGDIE